MLRYIATIAVAGTLLAIALRSRDAGPSGDATSHRNVIRTEPDIEAVAVAGGRNVTVRYRYAGSVSRASLSYELDARQQTADRVADCQRSLDAHSGLTDGGYVTLVTLSGFVPAGASRLTVVQESETGTQTIPIELN